MQKVFQKLLFVHKSRHCNILLNKWETAKYFITFKFHYIWNRKQKLRLSIWIQLYIPDQFSLTENLFFIRKIVKNVLLIVNKAILEYESLYLDIRSLNSKFWHYSRYLIIDMLSFHFIFINSSHFFEMIFNRYLSQLFIKLYHNFHLLTFSSNNTTITLNIFQCKFSWILWSENLSRICISELISEEKEKTAPRSQ